MRRFKWIDWNLHKIEAHGLSREEVEAAFNHIHDFCKRDDESAEMYAETPSGRRIWIAWRYDREDDEVPDIFGERLEPAFFVITAY
jgi:hypothetical protein